MCNQYSSTGLSYELRGRRESLCMLADDGSSFCDLRADDGEFPGTGVSYDASLNIVRYGDRYPSKKVRVIQN